MKYTIRETNKFKKDVKRCIKRGLPLKELKVVFKLLEESGQLPPKYRQHKLTGNYEGYWNVTSKPIGCLYGKRLRAS